MADMARVCLAIADESVSYELLQNLVRLGHQTATAYNAPSLLHRLGSERFDILLLGSSCALLGGRSVAPFVKATYAGMKVLVINDDAAASAISDDDDALAPSIPHILLAVGQALRVDITGD